MVFRLRGRLARKIHHTDREPLTRPISIMRRKIGITIGMTIGVEKYKRIGVGQ